MNRQKGFSLLEILVVFAIIGLLSALAASSFASAQMRARDSARKSDMAQLRSSLELAKSDNGLYYFVAGNSGNVYATLKTFLQGGGYMKSVPGDPKTGADYFYSSVSGSDYTLVACLENAKDSKADVNKNGYCTTASYTLTAP